jgi:hypothetical protein
MNNQKLLEIIQLTSPATEQTFGRCALVQMTKYWHLRPTVRIYLSRQ